MLKKKPSQLKLFLIGLLVLNLFLVGLWVYENPKVQGLQLSNTPQTSYPEVAELEGKDKSFDQLKKYFTDLAWKKGAEYAYSVLKIAPMPPNTDMHLMGHVVGDVLYQQQGLDGIKLCTNDFRNACSHSIVVGLLLDNGESILPKIAEACKQAPGGKGAYTMCYHGLGHGVLTYTAYNLPKTVELCQKTGTAEGIECIGGSIMELISGGDHDKVLWAKERPQYLKPADPFYPCLASFMPENARTLCLTYLVPYLWEAVDGNIGQPSSEDSEKAFALCAKLDNQYKNTCYGGFGKEFIVLAQNRDIRKIEDMTDSQLLQAYNWCELAKDPSGIEACLASGLSSLYWGGENNRQVSIRFCSVIPNSGQESTCFSNLIGYVKYYISDDTYKKSFCTELPANFKDQCSSALLTN
jgi:hypothetical protein